MKWEEEMMEVSERIRQHSINFCLFHREKREPVQSGVEFILPTRPVLTAHTGSKGLNCFHFSQEHGRRRVFNCQLCSRIGI